jgi:hypothetical protein
MPYATHFTSLKVSRSEPVGGIPMWVAVWGNRGRGQVMIGAPTLDDLQERWEQITNSDFDRTLAQRVVQVEWIDADAPKSQELPDSA